MENRFASNFDQVLNNALAIHAMGSGNSKERAFHESRTKNALYHIVIETNDMRIFAPIKWCAAPANTIDSYPVNKDPNTQKFRAAINKLGFNKISPGHNKHEELYTEFVEYCHAYGFKHSKPDRKKRHYHIWPHKIDTGMVFADEVNDPLSEYWEGATKTVKVNRYERDLSARTACIDEKGAFCNICELVFAEFYGDSCAGFIHVHHLVPLSEIRKGYHVNPSEDLLPVCPNCHAMLHRKNKAFGDRPPSVGELKAMIKSNQA